MRKHPTPHSRASHIDAMSKDTDIAPNRAGYRTAPTNGSECWPSCCTPSRTACRSSQRDRERRRTPGSWMMPGWRELSNPRCMRLQRVVAENYSDMNRWNKCITSTLTVSSPSHVGLGPRCALARRRQSNWVSRLDGLKNGGQGEKRDIHGRSLE